MNPQQSNKQSGGPNSTAKRLLVAVVIGGVIIVAMIVGFTLITSVGKANNDDLVTVQAWQTELARVIELGQKDISDRALANKVTTLELSLSTDQSAIGGLLQERGVKVEKSQLSSKKNADIDDDLEAAKQSGNFNTAFTQAIEEISNGYYASVKDALGDSASKKETDILNTAKTNMETIVTEK